MLPLSFDSRSTSPTPSDAASDTTLISNWSESLHHSTRPVADVVRRTSSRIWSLVSGAGADDSDLPALSARHRRRRSRGVLFFMPAFFTPSNGVELPTAAARSRSRSTTRPPPPELVPLHSREPTDETLVSDSEYPPDKPDLHSYPRTLQH